jgi:tetratricopeptide (TPR) repeat protein
MKQTLHTACIAGILVAVVLTTAGWGPQTDLAVVNTAVQLISQEGTLPLSRLARHVQAGAAISDERLEEFFPEFRQAPLEIIDSQIDLLKTVQGSQIDPYFAYRLGVLGKLVATVTAPMFNANPDYRRQYYADVDRNIERTELQASRRQTVEPGVYLRQLMQEAAQQERIVEREYQDGVGFRGVARAALSQDASRSVRAVADVWYTLLRSPATAGTISDRQVRQYVLDALKYYVDRGNMPEITAAYDRLATLNIANEAFYQQVGHMFFDAGMYERAIAEYEKVLASNPNNREVAQRMAEYYVRVGEQAVEAGRLESAFDYLTMAAQTDKLHPTAQQNLFRVERMIAERDARMAQQEHTLEQARELQIQAERMAAERRYALAVSTANQARELYGGVSDEFPQVSQQATVGLRSVQTLLSELQQDLIGNAQMLSGTGFVSEARHRASQAEALSEEGLRTLTRGNYQAELQELRRRHERLLEP